MSVQPPYMLAQPPFMLTCQRTAPIYAAAPAAINGCRANVNGGGHTAEGKCICTSQGTQIRPPA
eukprot:2839814-Rhodomonas_salina.2